MSVNFGDFLGNENLKSFLDLSFANNRLPQAIILQGEVGLGKKTMAKIIANMSVCTSEVKACGFCPACIRAKAGSHPDIRIEQGSGVSGNISVETIRDIIDDAQRKPDEADLNVYLLFVKNKISTASQNKLLKIMEEPPGKALFIITIPSADSLLPTIRSRAQTFTLFPVPLEDATNFCMDKLNLSYDECFELAKLYKGNIGAMLSGKSLPCEIATKTVEIFDSNDEDAFLALTYPLIKDRDMFCSYLENLRTIFRDALLFSEGIENFIGINHQQSKRIARIYRKSVLIKLPDICSDYIIYTKRNLNMNLLITAFCAKIRETLSK